MENQTVLLVDDDASLRKVLSALLVQAGLKTLEACCATEALASIERHVVDAVVTDLRMPGMTGMELLTQLTRLWPGLPVVVLTAHGSVRFIAATHQPLEKMVQEGAFREDLFYRLNVIPVDVPPLRDRPTDVALLVAQFAKDSSRSNGRDVRFDGEAVERLSRAPWPGNVRQLENLVERLVVLSDAAWVRVSEVERELAREAKRWPSSAADAATSLEGKKRELERAAVCDALAKADNNRSLAARLLGVSRRTLYNKIDEFGLGADGV